MSDAITDEPMDNLEKAMFWIEYVIKHNGAKYLRSSRVDITWFSFLMIDVLAFILLVSLVSAYINYKLFIFTFRAISNKLHKKRQIKEKLR